MTDVLDDGTALRHPAEGPCPPGCPTAAAEIAAYLTRSLMAKGYDVTVATEDVHAAIGWRGPVLLNSLLMVIRHTAQGWHQRTPAWCGRCGGRFTPSYRNQVFCATCGKLFGDRR